jgi:hypothetical protein
LKFVYPDTPETDYRIEDLDQLGGWRKSTAAPLNALEGFKELEKQREKDLR